MTAPASSQAHVEAVLDFANLDRQFAERLLASTQEAERAVNRNLSGITRAAQSSSQDINRAFDRIVVNIDMRGATQSFDRVERSAQQTGRQIDRSMQDAEQATDDAGESSHKFADSMGELVGKAAGAGVALLGVGTAFETISEVVERGELVNKLGAQLDLTKDESAQAGTIAGAVYAQNYGDSFEGVADATGAVMSSLTTLSGGGADAVEDLTKRVLTFSDTFGVEAAEVSQAANNMIQQGLVTNAPEALDLIGAAFQRVPQLMRDEVLPIINEYGTNLASLGFDGAQSMGLIVNASQQGAIAMDKVGDAIKEFGIRATDIGDTGAQDALKGLGLDAAATANSLLQGGDTAREAFQKIVSGLLEIKDPGEQAAASIALFGTPLEDLDKTKLPGFLMGLSNSGDAMEGFGGSIDRMGEQLAAGPGAQLELFHRQVQAVLIDGLGTAAGFVREHTTTFQGLAVALGVVVAAYGVLRLAALGQAVAMGISTAATGADAAALAANRIAMGAYTVASLAMRIGTLAGAAATGIATAATWALNAALAVLTSPITLIIAGIALFVGALVLLYNKNETFRNFVQAAWAAIQVAISVAWEFIKTIFSGIVQWVTGSLVPTLQNLWNIAVAVFNGISAAVQYWWTTFMQPIINNVVALVQGLLIPAFMFFWHNVIEPGFAAIGAIISFWWSGVQAVFGGVQAAVGFVAGIFMDWWHNTMSPVFDGVGSVVSLWWDGVQIIFGKIQSGIGLVGDAFRAAGAVMSGIWDGVLAAMRPAVHAIGNVLAKVPSKIGPAEIPGAGAAQDLGQALQRFGTGGLALGPGTGTSDSILAALSSGEYITNAAATAKWLPLLEAINRGADMAEILKMLLGLGLPGFAGGGLVNSAQLKSFAQGVEGVDYAWGGWGNGWLTDCSGAASALANYATNQLPAGQGQRSGTGAMSGFLSGLGAQDGIGPKGSLSFGWYNGGPYGGHIATTLPTGDKVEMGGARGNGQFNGQAVGADGPDFTEHAHFPPEFFAGGDLGGGAGLSPGAGGALNGGGAGAGAGSGGGAGLGSSSGGSTGTAGTLSADATRVFVTNWPGGSVPGATNFDPGTGGGSAAAAPAGTASAPGVGLDAANAWAAQQDFPKQAQSWAGDALKEIFGQVTDPLGVKSLSDKAVDQLVTAAQALAAARQNSNAPVVGVMNISGAGDPQAVGAAVVDSLAERMGAVTGRYRNGG